MIHDPKVIDVDGDYRITCGSAGLLVEVLDYHAGPLLLQEHHLRELGYQPIPVERTGNGATRRRQRRRTGAVEM